MLRTERLILDTWHSADWLEFRPVAADPEVMRYITGGAPWSDDQIRNFVHLQMILHERRGYCRWKIVEPSSGELIGFCGPGLWHDEADPEIGWWLARDYWGRGLATEAARAALADVVDRVGLKRIISVARRENTASIRVMQKLGLKFEANFESDGLELVRYAISKQ